MHRSIDRPIVHVCAGGLLAAVLGATAIRAQPARTPTAEPWRDKIHPALAQRVRESPNEPIEFIVVFDSAADLAPARRIVGKEAKTAFVVDRLRRHASATQAPLTAALAASGAETRTLWISNALWVRGDSSLVEAVARRDEVATVDGNPKSPHAAPQPLDAKVGTGGIEWNVGLVGADQVWALGYDGTGIVIGSQDTGFFWNHPALISSYRGWNGVSADHAYNWHDTVRSDTLASPTCLANSPEPCDDGFIFPHGTYTMGISVGDDGGTHQIGVSPGAKWIGCRNSDLAGGTPASYMECFQWLVAPTDLAGLNPDPALAPHVINNSWACIPAEGCNPDTLQTTVQNVRAAGIVVVAAAGNDGAECETIDYPPAIYDASLTVGATDGADVIGAISSRGPVTIDGSQRLKPDLTAPGIGVASAVGIWDIYTNDVLWDYAAANGTSASAPHVAGAIALLLDARPDLIGQVDAIEELLRVTARPFPSNQPCGGLGPAESPNNVYGHGRLDLVELFLGDADDDGVANLDDCALDDPTTWSLAGEIDDLQLAGGVDTTLSWTQPDEVGSTTFGYDVLRATFADGLLQSVCVESGQSATEATDDAVPGQLFFYVVQPVNPCGATPGTDSNGAPRGTPTCS